MFDYLLSKARKAGIPARIEADGVVIILEYRILGKCHTKVETKVTNYQEFKAIVGEEI